jgi:hypothetical protein
MSSKVKTLKGEGVGVSSSQHFAGRRACWNYGMGTRKTDNQVNYSHRHAQIRQQVG